MPPLRCAPQSRSTLLCDGRLLESHHVLKRVRQPTFNGQYCATFGGHFQRESVAYGEHGIRARHAIGSTAITGAIHLRNRVIRADNRLRVPVKNPSGDLSLFIVVEQVVRVAVPDKTHGPRNVGKEVVLVRVVEGQPVRGPGDEVRVGAGVVDRIRRRKIDGIATADGRGDNETEFVRVWVEDTFPKNATKLPRVASELRTSDNPA